MKDRFDIYSYKDKGDSVCMHCRTESESETFLKYLNELGYTWNTRRSYLGDSRFNIYKENTVYFFNSGTYCYVDYAIERGTIILEFSDFIWDSNDCCDEDYVVSDEEWENLSSFLDSFLTPNSCNT